MRPFLELVAATYLEKERDLLDGCCFVFPNKRSSLFFARYMEEAIRSSGATMMMPAITTIDTFVDSMVPGLADASRYDQLFTLYREYRRLSPGALEFDRFRFWGEMLLSDFNDVDRFLVNPDDLFVNLKRLREIKADYLTDEQRRIISVYWGDESVEQSVDRFWEHLSHPGPYVGDEGQGDPGFPRANTAAFMKLWEILSPLYHAFNGALAADGLATAGHKCRLAVDNLRCCRGEALSMERYVFVGFNVLTAAEIKMFEMLKTMGRADFYWDVNSPALRDTDNSALRMVQRNVSMFPSLHPLDEVPAGSYGNINIVSIPSKTAQAKYAGHVIDSLIKSGDITDTANAINTAVVLPDESLLVPVIHSLPQEVSSINVTMGYPMKLSPVSSLLRRIVSMHLRARQVDSDMRYYYEDVMSVASHPLMQLLDKDECMALYDHIRRLRLYMISRESIVAVTPSLAPVFRDLKDIRDFDEVSDYIHTLVSFLRDNIEAGDEGSSRRATVVLDSYIEALDSLRDAVGRYEITMEEGTVFQLLESALSSATVNFNGEPLHGLQVMGMLETRALDFDNLIILSMNERIFPRRLHAGSFIPEALRRGYGMSTTDHREAMSAYYFFRLLSRAKNVTLLYDGRTVGAGASEKSRYLTQLLYLFNKNGRIRHVAATFDSKAFEEKEITVAKTPRIMELLSQFTIDGGGRRLSPSSINKFINCPLQFYLEEVEGKRQPDEINDFMDASTYGTIVHSVMEELYISQRPDREVATPVEVTEAMLRGFLDEEVALQSIVTAKINEHYNHLPEGDTTPLKGDSFALGKLIDYYIREVIDEEIKMAPFTFIAAEFPTTMRLKINDSLTVNYRQVIDRIDRKDGTLRIIDYKTGGDRLAADSVGQLFDTSSSSRPKAILQLMLYCNVYSRHTGYHDAIQPMIYSLKSVTTTGLQPLALGRKKLTDYREHDEEFIKMFNAAVADIFDPEKPFVQAEDPSHCLFCQFKPLCRRKPVQM